MSSEIHSFVSAEDMSFQNLIEEVLSLFGPTSSLRKQMRFLGGNRLRSSVVMEC